MKQYLELLREYSREFIMVAGFVVAGCLYYDMRGYIGEHTKILEQISNRIFAIEQDLRDRGKL